MKGNKSQNYSYYEKISSAALYAIMSILVVFVNKIILSTYNFPYFYFLAASQFVSTCIILFALKIFRYIEITPLSWSIFLEIFPISILFLGNVVFGLGGTMSLNLPMFTALRRFSILLTMLGEYFVLSKVPSNPVMISVALMIGGALIAAMNDLTFHLGGYIMVFLNNFLTAMNGVMMKKATVSRTCSNMGILFYNSLFSFIALLVAGIAYDYSTYHSRGDHAVAVTTDSTVSIFMKVVEFDGWHNSSFLLTFLLASVAGSGLNYSIFICTAYNSALTTSVIGCLKNILVTYAGMFLMSDYVFNMLNFVGLNISILGSLYYTHVTLSPNQTTLPSVASSPRSKLEV
jgi:solute carrier family 35 protein